jgi:hypothetical protein
VCAPTTVPVYSILAVCSWEIEFVTMQAYQKLLGLYLLLTSTRATFESFSAGKTPTVAEG